MSKQETPSRPKVTVAIFAQNDGAKLAETMASVKLLLPCEAHLLAYGAPNSVIAEALDHMVLVTGIIHKDDLAAARNRVMSKADGDWILWLDAGERLSGETATELRAFLDENNDPRKAYLIMVETPSADAAHSNEQVAKMRLIPKRDDVRYEGRVGESLLPSIQRAGLAIDLAPGRILRPICVNAPEVRAQLARQTLDLIKKEVDGKENHDPRLLQAMGEAAADLGDMAMARQAFAEAVRNTPRGSTEMLEAYYGLLTAFGHDPKLAPQALTACMEALDVYPLDTQLLMATGHQLQLQNRLDLAENAFQTALDYGQVNLQAPHLRDVIDLITVCLAVTQQLRQKDEAARQTLEQGLARFPKSVRIRRQFLHLCIQHGWIEKAVAVAEGFPLESRDKEVFLDMVRGGCFAARKNWDAAMGYLQSAYLAGCQDPICLRWLAITLITNGHAEVALPVVQAWLKQEPDNPEAQACLEFAVHPITKKRAESNMAPVDLVIEGLPVDMPVSDSPSTGAV